MEALDGPHPPPELGERASALYLALMATRPMGPGDVVLIHEAARLVDRLDRLDQLVRGDVETWVSIEYDATKRKMTLVIDDALAEARQQASTLRQIIAQLKLPAAVEQSAGSRFDELERRRAERKASAS